MATQDDRTGAALPGYGSNFSPSGIAPGSPRRALPPAPGEAKELSARTGGRSARPRLAAPPSRPSAPAPPPPRRRLRNGRLWLRAAGGWHTAEAAAAGARSEPTTLPPRMTRGAPALTSLVPAADREQPRSRAGREHGKHGGAPHERNRAVSATRFSLLDGTPAKGSGPSARPRYG